MIFAPIFVFGQSVISGTVTNLMGGPVSHVPVYLSGDTNDVTLTDGFGNYSFTVANDGNYNVKPRSNADIRLGISTFDMVVIQRHFLGIELITNPYLQIAADVSNDDQISAADTSELFGVILFQLDDFPNNDSWRFIDASYVFPDPANAFSEDFPEDIDINSIQSDTPNNNFIVVKVGDMNPSGNLNVLPSDPCLNGCGYFTGKVGFDENENCNIDTDEISLAGFKILVTDNVNSYFTVSNELGEYQVKVPAGNYDVSILSPNPLWASCLASFNHSLVDLEYYNFDFQMQAVEDCPLLTVNLSATPFRPCFTNGLYVIEYCNEGTIAEDEAYLEVAFDSLINIIGSTLPWSTQVDNFFTFDLPELIPGQCGSIYVNFQTDCDAPLGKTLCNEAHIFPDSICIPMLTNWDGSNLEVSAQCMADSVSFTITNTGTDMTESVKYIVIEDHMIMMVSNSSEEIFLTEQESVSLNFPANGSTWRIEVEQIPNHPFSEVISAAIEGCGTNGQGTFSLGMINQFSQWTSGPSQDIDCDEVVASYDPNDKAAIPTGFFEEHFIEENVDLNYKIRFQNTGTDTAFTVLIRDTLSEFLDVSTINPGAASHPYRWNITEENIVEFYFPDILLPDSLVDEPGSHGFIHFKIKQKADNPLGTVIENRAGIYFDFNLPIITNTVFHTIGEDFLEIVDATFNTSNVQYELEVFPNPMHESAIIRFKGATIENGELLIYDMLGRRVGQKTFTGDSIELLRNKIDSGVYFFEIRNGPTSIASGKLIIH